MGSSSSGSADAAQRAEDERRAQIQATQKRIESIFGSPQREGEINQFIQDYRNLGTSDLRREKDINDRQLKFALARSGQAGGSTQVDQTRDLSDAFFRGATEVERRAQGAGQAVRQSDQEAKLQLFSQALGGLDTTTASQNATRALQQNLSGERNAAGEQGFDAFFKRFADIYKKSRESQSDRRASQELFTLYGQQPPGGFNIAGGSG
jgi:hypothetical protein